MSNSKTTMKRNRHTESNGQSHDGTCVLDTFDIHDFDDTGVALPTSLEKPDRLLARLNASHRHTQDIQQSDQLFSHLAASSATGDEAIATKRSPTHLWSIVVRAYADVRCDRSIDYVVADPEANLLFLRRCWELGAPASPTELNWLLMNSRKNGKLSSLPAAKRFSIPKERLDLFSFSADIAMRCVQDRLYFGEQRDVSIDQVMCDPHLIKEFDNFAVKLAPGFSKLDYRWAAIALRKARRSAPRSIQLSRLQSLGLLEDVRASKLPTSDALYWIQAGSFSLFTGVASNLQRQIEALVDRLGFNVLPDWMAERSKAKPELRICRADSFEAAEMARAGLLRREGARLNFRHGSFFGGAAA